MKSLQIWDKAYLCMLELDFLASNLEFFHCCFFLFCTLFAKGAPIRYCSLQRAFCSQTNVLAFKLSNDIIIGFESRLGLVRAGLAKSLALAGSLFTGHIIFFNK